MDLEETLSSLPQDKDEAIHLILKLFLADKFSNADRYEKIFSYYIALHTLVDNEETEVASTYNGVRLDKHEFPIFDSLDFSLGEEDLTSIMVRRINVLVQANKKIIGSKKFKESVDKTKLKMGKTFSYHFNDEEISTIQKIINELRNEINSKNFFEDSHKQRILSRLESLQSELHKKMSDLDRFWGLIGDTGVALGKFGNDAKPFAKLIRELTGAVWNAQARVEQIDSSEGFPLLTDNLE